MRDRDLKVGDEVAWFIHARSGKVPDRLSVSVGLRKAERQRGALGCKEGVSF